MSHDERNNSVGSAVTVPSSQPSGVSRRSFLASLTAGSLVLMAKVTHAQVQIVNADQTDVADFQPDLFLSIAPDGQVTILAHRSEMGTGIRTMLPRVVADELDADWNRVTIEQAPGDKRYGSQNTDGSNSIRNFFDRMRVAGATARTMLEQAAATRWNVPIGRVRTDLHKVVNTDTGASFGFGDLVESARTLDVPDEKSLKFKPRDKWRYIGKNTAPVDLDDILVGKAVYGIDARMDNQVFAVIARPPVVGGTVKSFNARAVKGMPGVVDVFELPAPTGALVFQPLGGVAVLANSTWEAWQGRDALEIEWDHGPNSVYNSTDYAKELKASANKPGKVLRKVGDGAAALADQGDKLVKADYSTPHLAHASMEVPCAVAMVETDASGKAISCHVIGATQNPQAAQETIGPAIGMKPDDVRVEVPLLGSAFGRKSKPDYCAEAAMLSKMCGRPVHVTMTREDDLRHDFYHATAAMHLEAAVGQSGTPTAWLTRVAHPAIASIFESNATTPYNWENEQGLTDLPYDIPNIQCEVGEAKAHVRIGWLRSVSHVFQNFAVSSFTDELARAAGEDPKDYLLKLLGPDRIVDFTGVDYPNNDASYEKYPYDIARAKHVIRQVAELADWDRSKTMPKGRGLGIAYARSFLSYTAHVIEVEVTKNGTLRVLKVWVVLDAGTIVSPDRVHAQMEGTVPFAYGHAKYGKITFKDGACEQGNYDDYSMVTMDESPEIVTKIIDSTAPPAGVGESTTPSFAPALCNAIFAATGKRIRDLPIADHDLAWA
jgi:isoquinoline 1-oxidoreductase beta subunit